RQPARCRRYDEVWPRFHGTAPPEAQFPRSPLICSHTRPQTFMDAWTGTRYNGAVEPKRATRSGARFGTKLFRANIKRL
ncbi:MAG: hypothetical protein Q8Q12_21150, partial [bacterium]|nr:hypothetical protein [bacterium]